MLLPQVPKDIFIETEMIKKIIKNKIKLFSTDFFFQWIKKYTIKIETKNKVVDLENKTINLKSSILKNSKSLLNEYG